MQSFQAGLANSPKESSRIMRNSKQAVSPFPSLIDCPELTTPRRGRSFDSWNAIYFTR
ncbi:hypothetical protein WN55_01958 [Dufourea novaeangliae]|uniref:Uncharacterized protein n=1 Tax=Dufourea novaeangliae TaxID=178035 RepID=A0A154PF99_DUFNO|nr:hypothetical protein WN55_01958 [Dufourea novaeangliae]